jgi:hypothetical protein
VPVEHANLRLGEPARSRGHAVQAAMTGPRVLACSI